MNRIVALGDSVMKGIVTDNAYHSEGALKYKIYEHNFIAQCEHSWGRPVLNLSRFGNTITGGIKCLSRHLKELCSGDVVVLEFGGNDCNFDWRAIAEDPDADHQPITTLAMFRHYYIQLIEMLSAQGLQTVLLSLPALDSQRFFNHISHGLCADNILRWLGGDVNTINNWHEQYNIEIFKIGATMRVPVIDISSIFLNKRNLSDYYCEDGMHPNEAGHHLIAQALANHPLNLQP